MGPTSTLSMLSSSNPEGLVHVPQDRFNQCNYDKLPGHCQRGMCRQNGDASDRLKVGKKKKSLHHLNRSFVETYRLCCSSHTKF